jgi:hypothetical protein
VLLRYLHVLGVAPCLPRTGSELGGNPNTPERNRLRECQPITGEHGPRGPPIAALGVQNPNSPSPFGHHRSAVGGGLLSARFPQNLRVITLGDARLSPVIGAAMEGAAVASLARPARRLGRTGLAAPKLSGGAVGQANPNDKE